MATYTEPTRALEFVIYEEEALSRDVITIASGAGVVTAGTVLGKITTGGKYTPYDDGLTNGAETAVCINCYTVDATSADVSVAAIMRLSAVKTAALQWHSSADATAKTAAYTALAAHHIIARS